MDIEAGLTSYIRDELLDGAGSVGLEDRLLADGLVDSLGIMRLVSHITDTYGVDVPPEDVVLENFGSVSAMAAYLRGRGV